MSAGDRLWKEACHEKFIKKVGEILAQFRRQEIEKDEAFDEIDYNYNDLIGDE